MRRNKHGRMMFWFGVGSFGAAGLLAWVGTAVPKNDFAAEASVFWFAAGLFFAVCWSVIKLLRAGTSREIAPAAPAVKERHPDAKPCWQCRTNHTIVICEAHGVGLCVGCMFRHDDLHACFYVPDSNKRRAAGGAAGKAQYASTFSGNR